MILKFFGNFEFYGDLLSHRNVLVGEGISVKISDFGLSRSLAKENAYYHLTQTKKLPVKWMALESLLYRKFSTYSDGKLYFDINFIISFHL